jgi:hypothetical protein
VQIHIHSFTVSNQSSSALDFESVIGEPCLLGFGGGLLVGAVAV